MSSFVARRLEVLSDIMFGVAMTVPVYSLPLPGPEARLTSWRPVLRPLLGPLVALGCSFLFTSIFWFSHHRRLRLTRARTRRSLFITFAFLFLIVTLPGSTVLYGHDAFVPWVATLYSGHLAISSRARTCSLVYVHSVAIAATVAVGDRARYPGARLPGCRACQPVVTTVNGDVVVGDRPCSYC